MIEDVESSASYLRIAQCDRRFEVLAIIAQKQLSHAYFRESSTRKLLSFEVSKARKRTLEDEVQEATKRLRKQDDKRTWDTTEILIARGYTAEETAGYIDILPNRALIYNVGEEPSI